MPPRRRAAAAAAAAAAPPPPAAPTVPPLDGCVIAISGKFDASKHTHASLEQLIRSLGGSVTKSVAKTTTHVVCSEDDYNNDSAKVAAAKAKDLPIVSVEWIQEAEKLNKAVDPQPYVWGRPKAAAPQVNSKKRRLVESMSDEDEEPQRKRVKIDTSNPKPQGAKTKAKADAAPEPETREEKQVAEGQFIKKKDAAIPVDEHCPLLYNQVHIDPDTGLIYDASLNQTNASANNNKFYRIQVSCALSRFAFGLRPSIDARLPRSYTTPSQSSTRLGHAGAASEKSARAPSSATAPPQMQSRTSKRSSRTSLAWPGRTGATTRSRASTPLSSGATIQTRTTKTTRPMTRPSRRRTTTKKRSSPRSALFRSRSSPSWSSSSTSSTSRPL
jgi:hypothetical protein